MRPPPQTRNALLEGGRAAERPAPATLIEPRDPWRAVAIGAAALAFGLGSLFLVWRLATPLVLLVLAITLAEALEPPVEWLGHRLPRAAAIALVYLVLALAIVAAGWWMIPTLSEQTQRLVASGPDLVAAIQRLLDRLDPEVTDQAAAALRGRIDQFLTVLVAVPVAIASSLLQVFLVVILSIYWLAVAPALRRFARSLAPARDRGETDDVVREVGRAMGGYVRGAVIDAVVTGLIAYVGLLVVGFEFPALAGVLTAVGELVPVVGPTVVAVPIVAIALLQSPGQALLVLVVYVVVVNVEANLVTPFIMRSQTNLPSILVLFALFAGGTLGGVLGALAAIPLAAALMVLMERVVAPAIRRWTGAAPGDAR